MGEAADVQGHSSDEATLELTLISSEILTNYTHNHIRPSSFFPKSAIAWIDPSFKVPIKTLTLPHKLHFPLSLSTLQNPTSQLTIHIHSHRLPFSAAVAAKLLGVATLRLSCLRFAGETLAVQIRKPSSGRVCGSIRMAARILWCLDFPASSSCSSSTTIITSAVVEPSAPPLPEDFASVADELENESGEWGEFWGEVQQQNADMMVGSTDPPVVDSTDASVGPTLSDESGDCEKKVHVERVREGGSGDGKGAWSSFVVGLASGAIAAVLVGAVGCYEG